MDVPGGSNTFSSIATGAPAQAAAGARTACPGAALFILGVAVVACGGPEKAGARAASLVGPTRTESIRYPIISATVVTSPLEAKVRVLTGSTVRYEIQATVTFREAAGIAARVTGLDTTVLTPSGFTHTVRTEAGIDIPPAGAATYALTHAFEAGAPLDGGLWRITGYGETPEGHAFEIVPLDVPLTFQRLLPSQQTAPDAVFVGAGDIAVCGSRGAELTARLLDGIGGTVFTLGDNVYPFGSLANYQACYEPTWGRHRSRTRATPGNHDWSEGDGGASYFAYFGTAAGPSGLGYYSFDLGAWHVLALNSEMPMQAGSAQYEWLRADLAASRAVCTLAYWHHPLFTSGQNSPESRSRDVWRVLYAAGADIILNGHEHAFERFAPQDPNGRPDARGIRQFTVGTGGAPLYRRRTTAVNSEVYDSSSWGVLKLTLKARSYAWEFIPAAGGIFRDAGTGTCVE